MQVLEHQDKRLHLALAQEQPLDRLEGLLAPLRRTECLPLRIVDRHVEQAQERRKRHLQRTVDRKHLAGDLLADLSVRVAVVDGEVRLQHVDDRKVARGLSVGHRVRLEHERSLRPMRSGELVEQPGLAHARLADDRDDLPSTVARLLMGAPEQVHLGVPADERRETSGGRGLEPGPHGRRARQLVGLHRLVEPLDAHRTERLDHDITLDEP